VDGRKTLNEKFNELRHLSDGVAKQHEK